MTSKKRLITYILCLLTITACNVSLAQAVRAEKKSKGEQNTASKETKDSEKSSPDGKKAALVDINSASKEELMKIPGIGARYSDEIINGRPYKSKNQLVSKKVLPDVLYKTISDKIIAKQSKKK